MAEPEQQTEGPSAKRLRGLVERIDDLPTLPSVITRIVKMVEDRETSAQDMQEVISQDPSLTAKVLKLVNSAFYGFSRQISTVREAVVILGFNRVKSLALSASVFEVFKGPGTKKFDRVGLWEHSIATGIAGEILSNRVEYDNPEEVVVAGILHHIGKIIIDIYFHDELNEIFDYVEENDALMIEAEEEILGVSHPRIGAWLAEHWKIPEHIVAAIRYYPDPMNADQGMQTLPMLTHVGDILARSKDFGWTGDHKIPSLDPEVKDILNLSKDDIPTILDHLESEMEDAKAFLELSEGEVED